MVLQYWLFELSLLGQRKAEVIVYRLEVRIEANGLLVRGSCLSVLFLVGEHQPDSRVGAGCVGLDANGLPVFDESFVSLAQLDQSIAEGFVGAASSGCHRLAVNGEAHIKFFLLQKFGTRE